MSRRNRGGSRAGRQASPCWGERGGGGDKRATMVLFAIAEEDCLSRHFVHDKYVLAFVER